MEAIGKPSSRRALKGALESVDLGEAGIIVYLPVR
jgi:hypothetical protein